MSDSPYRYDSREDYPAAWGMTPEQYAGTRENYDSTHQGNPFRERRVCQEHAAIMVASGWYVLSPAASTEEPQG